MALVLYYGSGSPYAWKVQLALEHKALPYERRILSFSAGDTRKPEFVALNPRHRVPTIDDDGFVLYESNAIVEYLDEQYAGRGAPLFPGDVRTRALVRRLVCEVDNYFDEALDEITTPLFYRKGRRRLSFANLQIQGRQGFSPQTDQQDHRERRTPHLRDLGFPRVSLRKGRRYPPHHFRTRDEGHGEPEGRSTAGGDRPVGSRQQT